MTMNPKAAALSAMLKDCTPADLINVIAMACDELDGREVARAVCEHTGRIGLECDDLESIIEAVNATPAEITGAEAQGVTA